MNILVDTHTHTNVSAHAYSSLEENIRHAKNIGLEAIVMTNHGPAITDGAHEWHFLNARRNIPGEVDGVKVLIGAEVNILDENGNIDLTERALNELDVVIASMHIPTFAPATKQIHTNAYLNVLDNPYVDIIGHSGTAVFEYDIEKVLEKAKKEHKMIEINNNSFLMRKGSVENCVKIAKKCAEMGVYIVVGSDAHFSRGVGNFTAAADMLKEIDFPEELVANLNFERFLSVLRKRKTIAGF